MTAPYARIIRRETHSPRTIATLVFAILVLAGCAYAGTELVLAMLARPALLVAPADAGTWVATLPDQEPLWAISAGGIVLLLVGLLLLLHVLRPGRLAKHQMVLGETPVIVDNGVIASAIARRVEQLSGLPRSQVGVTVSHRRAEVHVTPTSGRTVDHDAIRRAVADEIDSYSLRPRVVPRVRVTDDGVVGA